MNHEDITFLMGLILVIVVFIYFITRPNKEDLAYKKRLKNNLEDEYIVDPETGTKLTLEQAESGHWISHDNEFNTVPETEIDKLFTEEDKEAERGLNYLKESLDYRKQNLSNDDINILKTTKILSKYDDWSYSDSFRIEFKNGFVFFPAVEIHDKMPGYFDNSYIESQLMFWLKLDFNSGHYFFKEKTGLEKLIKSFNNTKELSIKGYETYTFRTTGNLFKTNIILDAFIGSKGLEIELMENNLFIKTLKKVNLKDILRLEKIIKLMTNTHS